jgi:chromosome condensin MukBEF ATPase and DNA-binding subunit MukB
MQVRNTVETAYGTVDAAALRELQGRFPTADLLKAAESIAAQRLWLRESLVRLHGMTRHLIDRAPATIEAQEPVWQLAEEIADQLDASAAELAATVSLVDRLARLRPQP